MNLPKIYLKKALWDTKEKGKVLCITEEAKMTPPLRN